MKCTVLIFDTRRFGGGRETCITTLLVSATYLLGKPLLFTLYFVATALFGDEIGAVLLLASTVELTKPTHTKKVRVYYLFILISRHLFGFTWVLETCFIQRIQIFSNYLYRRRS
jgi:hypothetical protein